MRVWSAVLLLVLFCSACGVASSSPGEPSATLTPESNTRAAAASTQRNSTPTETLNAPSATAAKPTSPAITQLPPIGERMAFQSEDGTPLLGEYFPSRNEPAPAVILMHPMNSNRRIWVRKGVVNWLNHSNQGSLSPATAASNVLNWRPLPENLSFAVFIFDFRGHGESKGGGGERSDYLMDARAALAVVRGLPGIDPQRIVMIGASIGADASADVCGEGCMGALGLSPGGFLGVPYADTVAQLSQAGKPVWCLAGSGDTRSAQTCVSASGDRYRSQVYSGISAHGVDLLVPGLDPDITVVFREFLAQVFDF